MTRTDRFLVPELVLYIEDHIPLEKKKLLILQEDGTTREQMAMEKAVVITGIRAPVATKQVKHATRTEGDQEDKDLGGTTTLERAVVEMIYIGICQGKVHINQTGRPIRQHML